VREGGEGRVRQREEGGNQLNSFNTLTQGRHFPGGDRILSALQRNINHSFELGMSGACMCESEILGYDIVEARARTGDHGHEGLFGK
jgi:hypothetical protein